MGPGAAKGLLVREIADRDGVSHQYVSRMTVEHGPYPAAEAVQEWVELRRAGHSVAAIAEEHGVRESVARQATRPFGPFGTRGPRLPSGLVGVTTLAQRVGMGHPSVLRWVRTGRTPPPDFVTARGRVLWLDCTITAWLDSGPLQECPRCGARCVSLGQHQARAHSRSGSSGLDSGEVDGEG